MKKKTNVKTLIRQIVREEVAMAIQEVIKEITEPTIENKVTKPKQKKKMVETKSFTKNSVINSILNETAQNDEWKTMGGGTYDSSKVNEVLSSQYGDLMNDDTTGDKMVASMGKNPNTVPDHIKNALVKDYSEVLKKSKEKTALKNGR